MTGTFINVAAILIGGTIGLIFGSRIPERYKNTVIAGMGLFTAAMGLQMFFKSNNQLIVLGALIIGALLGEWIRIEDGLQAIGQMLEKRFSQDTDPFDQGFDTVSEGRTVNPSTQVNSGSSSRFVRGFMVSSLLFCIGPMAILGSIQDGLTSDYKLLAVKSTLDGFASIAFASTLGVGVMFSSLIILVYQGGISLLAGQLNSIVTDPMMSEMTATGGVILMGVAFNNLLEIKKIRVGNFLPALAVAPLIVWVMSLF